MTNMKTSNSFLIVRLTLALMMILLWVSPWTSRPVQAGSGATVDIPLSTIVPTMDGECNPTEYADAVQVIVPVGPTLTFPVYMKRTINDAYFCFGDATGLPQPMGSNPPSVTIYIDRNNDGLINGNNADDFGVWTSYGSTLPTSWSNTWGGTTYNGADPGGWQAVKYQVPSNWQVEYKISSQTMGGWKHSVGIALFYHWWQFDSDDYSWPANGIWASPANWGNAPLSMPRVDIDNSSVVPTMDGQCEETSEYLDASTTPFAVPGGTATAYFKHSLTDLYVCLKGLAVPDVQFQGSPNAVLLVDRANTAGGAPAATHLSLTISYNNTVLAGSGDGAGFTSPLLGDYQAIAFPTAGGWDAEFRLNSAVVGNWWARRIGLSVAEMNVLVAGDSHAWPAGSSNLIPYTWGEGNLLNLGQKFFLPTIAN